MAGAYNPFRRIELVSSFGQYFGTVLALEVQTARRGSQARRFLLAADGRGLARDVSAGRLPVGVFCDWLDDHAGGLGGPDAKFIRQAAAALRFRGRFFNGSKAAAHRRDRRLATAGT